MTNTRTQGPRTGLTTPIRGTSNDPVTSGSMDSFLEVQASDSDNALPTKRHLIVVETVEEEDEADIARLSDLDEGLSDGASLCGDKPGFAGSQNLQDLIWHGQEHCRLPCNRQQALLVPQTSKI
jgi:hypothetical protein